MQSTEPIIRQFTLEEKQQIEDATFSIREQLRRAKRNYEGRYDNPIDKYTGKRKVFYPLTEQEVDTIKTRFDLDPDALFIDTNEPDQKRKALIWQQLIRQQLKMMEFQTRFSPIKTDFTNLGTILLELYYNTEKKHIDFRYHDLKDVYIFPKELDVSSSSAFAVKQTVLFADFFNNKEFKNKEDVKGNTLVSDTMSNNNLRTQAIETGKYSYSTELETVDLYTRYGWFPKYLQSNSVKDHDQRTLIRGKITIANPDHTPVVVQIEESDDYLNFIDAFFGKRPYLYYGRGVGIKLRDQQFLMNKIVNRRDDNEDILHRGMFLKRRGVNIDARQTITGSGVWIDVDDPTDITQLRTSDITGNSYASENNIIESVQRLNGTYEIIRGTGNSSSATDAAIKDKNAGSRFLDPQESLNQMFTRMAKRMIDLSRKHLSRGTIVKFSGSDEELALFDDFGLKTVNKARLEEGLMPITKDEYTEALNKLGKERTIKTPNMKLLSGDFFPIYDTDTSMIKNRAGAAQQVLELMQVAAQVPGVADQIDFADAFEQYSKILGVKLKRKPTPTTLGLPGGIQAGGQPEQAEALQSLQALGGATPQQTQPVI